jgi:hypothetical protein
VRDWAGAVQVAQGRRWAILLLSIVQRPNGTWLYTYSIAPGVVVPWVTGGGFATVSAYDTAIIGAISAIAARARLPAEPAPVPDTWL